MIKWKLAYQKMAYYRRVNSQKAEALRDLIQAALPPMQTAMYRAICTYPGHTTPDLAEHLHISNGSAWDLCRKLERAYLVSAKFHYRKHAYVWRER